MSEDLTPIECERKLRGLVTAMSQAQTDSHAARFWEKVSNLGDPDGCWLWTAATSSAGYGVFHPTKKAIVQSHRWALAHSLKRPITPGMEVLHSCDNPPCVNPAHLREGTRQDNVDDAVKRGRHSFGTGRPNATLTDDQVVRIRERFAAGETITSLADEYSVGLATASRIVNGRSWKHLGGPIRNQPSRGRRVLRKAV